MPHLEHVVTVQRSVALLHVVDAVDFPHALRMQLHLPLPCLGLDQGLKVHVHEAPVNSKVPRSFDIPS